MQTEEFGNPEGAGNLSRSKRDRKAEAERRVTKALEKNKNDGEKKQPAPSSPLNEELKVIRRVARALEGLDNSAKGRVLFYIQQSVDQERLSRSLGKEAPWIEGMPMR